MFLEPGLAVVEVRLKIAMLYKLHDDVQVVFSFMVADILYDIGLDA